MNRLTNMGSLGLAMAVWLAHDEYSSGAEEHPGANVVSATALLKSTRQFVLQNRLGPSENIVDIADLFSSRIGQAVHDSQEHAWKTGYREAMQRLGYPQKLIDRVIINPTDEVLQKERDMGYEPFPVYLEQRYFRPITVDGFEIIVSGKFDQIIGGELNDTKTTSVWAYMNRTKEEDYSIQLSIYRWISPDKVTSDLARIQHLFTDWQRSQARANPNYPQNRGLEFPVQLMGEAETEAWIVTKLREIIRNQNTPEPDLPHCSETELWMSAPVYKYYADPKKAAEGGRSSKNFDDLGTAQLHLSKQGKGTIVTVPGQAKACGYCPAFLICSQKDLYDHA